MKMKRLIIFLALVVLVQASGVVTAFAAGNEIKVVVDGKQLTFDVPPVIENDRVLVPMRAIFEALGYTVEWYGEYNSASATKKSGDIKREAYVYVPQKCMMVSESRYAPGSLSSETYGNPSSKISFYVPLDPVNSPIKIVNSRILLPTRAIAEALGCRVDWDGANRTVIIDTKGSRIIPPDGWVEAIEAHCVNYAPDFLVLRDKWKGDEIKNQLALAGDVNVTTPNPGSSGDNNGEKIYTVFDHIWNREFKYTYKNPVMPASPLAVGSAPAKILIDESHPTPSYSNPVKQGEWIHNLTECYSIGATWGCNWYAGGRFWEVYGIPFPYFDRIFGVAEYLDKAETYGEFTVVRDINYIRPYSIAVFVPAELGATSHVLFVEYVERDSQGKPINVYFTEANANNPTGKYRHGIDGAVKKLAFDKFIYRVNQKCIGYIIPNADFYK